MHLLLKKPDYFLYILYLKIIKKQVCCAGKETYSATTIVINNPDSLVNNEDLKRNLAHNISI